MNKLSIFNDDQRDDIERIMSFLVSKNGDWPELGDDVLVDEFLMNMCKENISNAKNIIYNKYQKISHKNTIIKKYSKHGYDNYGVTIFFLNESGEKTNVMITFTKVRNKFLLGSCAQKNSY